MAAELQSGQTVPVQSLDDPRIAAYRNLKDHQLDRAGRRFIAEGELVVRRLLTSRLAGCVESLLVAEDRVAAIAPLAPPVTIFAAPRELLSRIVGFQFHSGVMACGVRPAMPALAELARGWAGEVTLVVLPETTSTSNLGSLLRISAAFGATAVLLGPRTCDPFYRQSIRVSMGAVFHLPLARSSDLVADLRALRDNWGVQLVASVLDESAEPLTAVRRSARTALLFGNEAQGLRSDVLAECDRRVTIPMRLGTDSLNVAVAAGVFLYHFTFNLGC
jgi:tRNA G18 (ribose-2'-O)-methylase SpoU